MVTFFLVNPTRQISLISILVSFKGKKYRRSIKESVPVKLWNKSKKRVKVTADYVHGNMINDMISKWESAALRATSYFKEFFHPPTPEEFFARLDKEFYKDDASAPKPPLFAEYMQIYIKRYKDVKSIGTIKKYITTYNKIIEYEKENKKALRFEDIDIIFYNNFQTWIYKQGYSDNYFGTFIKIIKQMYREANIVDRLHNLNHIEHKGFVAINKASENIYLTEYELLKIYQLNITPELIFEKYPNLSKSQISSKIRSMLIVRDRFLIGAYTGLRVSDFRRLNETNIGDHIRIKTSKTGANVVIPIHPIIKEIIDNGFDANITVSDQKINQHIKEIAQLAGITETVLIHSNVAGEVKQKNIEKYKLVCTHTARRSFATNAYKSGVPTIAIMKITGHTKETTFLKYIKVSAEENADMLKNHPFFGGNNVTKCRTKKVL